MAADLKPKAEATIRTQVRRLRTLRDALPRGDRRAPAIEAALHALEWVRGAASRTPHDVLADAEG